MADDKPAKEPTPWDRFRDATKRVLSVPKAEIDKREKAWRKKRQKKR